MDRIILISRVAAGTVTIVLGSALQLLLWKSEQKSILLALFTFPFLWLLYCFIGLLLGEHLCKFLSGRLPKEDFVPHEKARYMFSDNTASIGSIHHLSEIGDIEGIKRLLDKDPTLIHAKARFDRTPLHEASLNGQLAAAELLIEHGASVEATDEDNRSPLHWSVYWNYVSLSGFLISCDADINARDNYGQTPLFVAFEELLIGDHTSIVDLLLSKGADPNIADNDGNTPMHLAIYSEEIESIKLLLAAGANVNFPNALGKTPLQEAKKRVLRKLKPLIE